MNLGQFLERIQSDDFDQAGYAFILGHRVVDRAVHIDIELGTAIDADERSRFLIRCDDVFEFRIGSGVSDWVSFTDEHPAALQFSRPHCQLYFRGDCHDPSRVAAELWQVHERATRGYIPFSRYVNLLQPLPGLLAGNHGQLADGPVWLVAEYEDVLRQFGMSHNRLPERTFKKWEDGRFEEAPPDLWALILGESYFVGRSFSAEIA